MGVAVGPIPGAERPVGALRCAPSLQHGWVGGNQPAHARTPAPPTPPQPLAAVTSSPCLFCRIVAGEIPATIVYETDQLLAFRDINPQAPVHVLVIPRTHITSLAHAEAEHQDLLGALALAAAHVARQEGLAEGGYRTVVNTGTDGGQSVGHVHFHVLGGRALGWPPG